MNEEKFAEILGRVYYRLDELEKAKVSLVNEIEQERQRVTKLGQALRQTQHSEAALRQTLKNRGWL